MEEHGDGSVVVALAAQEGTGSTQGHGGAAKQKRKSGVSKSELLSLQQSNQRMDGSYWRQSRASERQLASTYLLEHTTDKEDDNDDTDDDVDDGDDVVDVVEDADDADDVDEFPKLIEI